MNDEEIQGLKDAEKEALETYEYIEPVYEELMEASVEEPTAAAAPAPTPRRSHRRQRKNNDWVGGLILIGLGVIFLLNSFNIELIQNWWALFLLIPGLANLKNGLQARAADGRFSHSARGSLIGGLFLTTIGSAFLFDLNWSYIWPIFLIIFGIGALMQR